MPLPGVSAIAASDRMNILWKNINRITSVVCLISIGLSSAACGFHRNNTAILQRADQFFQRGEYEKAKIEYLNARRIDNQNAHAFQQLGFIWLGQGAPLRALPFLIRTRQLAPDNLASRAKLASAYLAVGDAADARKEALAVLERDPASADCLMIVADTSQGKEEIAATEQQLNKFPAKNTAAFHLAAASLATRKAESSDAADQLQQALATEPNSARAHLRMGYLYLLRRNPGHAESELKTAADLAPPRSEERIQYAEFKASNGAVDEAKKILTGITKEAPDYFPAWGRLARIALSEKKYDEGLSFLENIFSRDAQNPEARLLQSTFFLAKGDRVKAIATLGKLNEAYPNNPLVKLQVGRAYFQNNNIVQATAALEQAVAAKPNYVEAILTLAELNIRAGKIQAAVSALEDLLRKTPNFPQAQVLLIEGYQALGRSDEAIALCRERIKGAPNSADGYYMLGLILHQQQKDDEARTALEKAAELAPDNFNFLDKLVELDLAAKRYDSAKERVQTLAQKNPNAAAPYFLEAKIYSSSGPQQDLSRAESSLRKALALDPNFTSAYDLLISVYVAANKSDEALKELNAELTKNPKNQRALLMRALLDDKLKDYPAARDSYEQLLALDGDSFLALNNLAYLYAERLNDLDKAYELAQRARTLEPRDGIVADTFGWILYKRGEYQQALGLLQDSAAKFPDNPELQFHLGMAHYMMGNTDAARSALEKAVRSDAAFPGKEEAQQRLTQLAKGSANSGRSQPAATSTQSNDVIALLREAEAYEQQGNDGKAAASYEQAFKVNPKLATTALKIAQLNSGSLHQLAKALEFARKARDLAPNDPQVAGAVGRIALQTGNITWASSLLQESTRRGVNDPAILHDLAMATYLSGKVGEARQIMQRAMEAKPPADEAEEGRRFLAMTSVELPSQTDIASALNAQPNYVPAVMAQAASDLKQNNREKAAQIYQEVLKKYPDFAPAQKQLATIYATDSANLKQAYELGMKARKVLPDDPELARTLAEVSFKRNEFNYAVQLFQESGAKQPLGAKDLYYLGIAQLRNRQEAKGRETLQQALAAGLQDPLAQDAKNRLAEQAR